MVPTTALGIAANTSIFTVVHAVLLNPLPYQCRTAGHGLARHARSGGPPNEWRPGVCRLARRDRDVCVNRVDRSFGLALTGLGDAEVVPGEQVTQSYFDVLGVQPEKGRAFRPEECVPNAPRVVIVSHEFWQQRLGGAEDVLTRQVVLADEPHQIVGVMPAGFRPVIVSNASFWRPDRLNLTTPSRGAIVLRVVARLKSGVSIDQASASMTRLAQTLSQRSDPTPTWPQRRAARAGGQRSAGNVDAHRSGRAGAAYHVRQYCEPARPRQRPRARNGRAIGAWRWTRRSFDSLTESVVLGGRSGASR